MLKSFFHALYIFAFLSSVTLAQSPLSGSVIDYASVCGLATPETSIVRFAFADGSPLIADGDIVTASLSLNQAYYDNPPRSVAISTPGVKCGRSSFTFDKSDPSTFDQSVTCRTDGAVVAAAKDGATVDLAMVLDFELSSVDAMLQETIRKMCLKLLLQRQLSNSGHGGGTGDPHLTTFDGLNYDFQVPGVFRLFQSRNWLVQVFQEKCTPVVSRGDKAPSCYQGLAVAFAGSIAKFYIQGGTIQLGKGTSSLDWLAVEKLKGRTDGYRVFVAADHASYVDVTLGTWINNYAYLNIAVKASPYFKDTSVQGLLGNWNGVKSDDLHNNAQLATLHGAALANNLFTCLGDSCTPFLQPASLKDDMARALPNNMSMLHQSYVAVNPTTIPLRVFAPVLVPYVQQRYLETSDNGSHAGVVHAAMNANESTSTTNNDTITFPPSHGGVPDVRERAHELCTQVITQIPICDKYVANRTFYIETVCTSDAVLLGDLSVVDSTKLSYLRECRRELDGRIEGETSPVAERQTLLADRAALAFGDISTCVNHCSGRGTCLAAGCKCDAGFTGFMCDTVV